MVGIVDDDELVRDSISSLLRSTGYRSVGFASAEDFLDEANKCEAACLVVDVRIPRGLNGFELQQRLSELRRSVPIIFITGSGDEDARAKALKQGAVAFLNKPFSGEDLLSALQSALDPGNRG
jgi:FixJ family two-component response regulator